jgi:ATP-dependent RNA helicase DHX37/DHR1
MQVAAWQLRQAGAAAAAELAAAAGTSPPSSSTASQALPFAIALAAVLTVEEPFMHLDASSVGGAAGGQAGKDGEGQQQQQAEEDGEGEDEGEEGGLKRRRRESGSSAGQGPGSDAAAKAAEAAQLQKLNRMRAAQGRLKGKCGEGDALAALAALCAYEASGESEEFCSEHALHHRPLKEAADLHRQLLRVFAALAAQHQQEAQGHPAKGSGATGLPLVKGGPLAVSLCSVAASDQGQALLEAVQQLDTAGSRGRLPTLVSDCLKRAMAVGWADQVARRVRSAEALARLRAKAEGAHGGGKRHAVRYMSAAMANAHGQGPESLAAAAATRRAEAAGLDEDVSGDVYLHPRSSIHAAAPEYVVYLQVVRTAKRPYMMGPTPVQVSCA